MAEEAQKKYSVAVLSGYAAQLKLLNRNLASLLNNWQALTVECNTVMPSKDVRLISLCIL
jgi:hypothetical protein